MLNKQTIGGIKWVDGVRLDGKELQKILEKYNIHELDIKACVEGNQRARVDIYEDYAFLVFHFPKYNKVANVYEINEFNIFLSNTFLITLRDFPFSKVNHVFKGYEPQSNITDVRSAYIVYELIQAMIDKTFQTLKELRMEVRELEKKVFEGGSSLLVKDIMRKKRNIVFLKHLFKPQLIVLKQLQNVKQIGTADDMKAYFEESEDKMSQIMTEIDILWERIDSVEDAFKSILDIKTNFIIKVLTIFSAFLLPLTLITSFYGMNIQLPYAHNSIFVFELLGFSVVLMLVIYLFLKRNGKF